MKQKSVFFGILMSLFIITFFNGCAADVNLGDIDTTIGADIALALPVGGFSAEIDDFLGMTDTANLIKIDSDGMLFLQESFEIEHTLVEINLEDYVVEYSGAADINPTEIPISSPIDMAFPLQIPITVTVPEVNTPTNKDVRVDSVGAGASHFTFNFNVEGVTGLSFDNIQNIKLVLSDQFSRKGGHEIEFDLSGKSFNQDISLLIDDFTLSFMKDKNEEPSIDNVTNTIDFEIHFTFHITPGMTINPNASVQFSCKYYFEDYQAVWGWGATNLTFESGSTVNLADRWTGWSKIKNLEVKLAKPTIQLSLTHGITAPLQLKTQIFVASGNQRKYATFNGNTEWIWNLDNLVGLSDDINASATNTYTLSNAPEAGAIDQIFEVKPDTIGYNFSIGLNNDYRDENGQELKQYRIAHNLDVSAEAIIYIPLEFNDSMSLSYSDTIGNINISQLAIDTLIEQVETLKEVRLNALKLILLVENTIPFNIIANLTFLGENDNELNLGLFKTGDVENNIFHIACPTNVIDGIVQEPARKEIIVDIDQEDYDQLVQLKKIAFTATLGENSVPVKVLKQSGLRIGIAVAADVSAVADLNGVLFNE